MDVVAAYAECARITRAEAKNFAYGIRLLPAAKRDAMSALYAWARRIDDIADGDHPIGDKLAALAAVDDQVTAIAGGHLPDAGDAVLVGVHHAASAFPIPVAAVSEIVEGCRRDSIGVGYATFADTEAYCRLVAGSVGRLSLGVFGHRGSDGHTSVASLADDHASAASLADDHASVASLADDLGVALQLTNILRDVREDAEVMGRVYLPADDLKRFGCETDLSGPPAAVADLVAHYTTVAEDFFGRGRPLLGLLDRRSRACVAAMSGIYHRLLAKIAAEPAAVTRARVSLTTTEKLWVAARSLAGATT